MQALELPFSPTISSIPQIKEVTHTDLSRDTPNPHKSLENVINSIFPEQSEENKLAKTRKNLGEIGKTLSDEQIECINTEFQFIIDTWLNEYEKDVFKGMTLKEVLNEK